MKCDGREVASAPAGGGDTGRGVCSGVVAGGLATVDVLAGCEGHVAAGRVFVEPEPAVAHWRAGKAHGLRSGGAGETLAVGWTAGAERAQAVFQLAESQKRGPGLIAQFN